MAEGVDLYGKYNKVTDWRAVRADGIEFAWIKLSDGNTNRDDYGYVKAGRDVGIVMGGYHYAQPGDPVAQANRLIERCAAYGALDLAPALDLEDPFVPDSAAIQFAVRFLLRLAERGHVPVLYANQAMLSGVLAPIRSALEAAGVRTLKVWGARYGGSLTVPHEVHQYTSKGRVAGIVGDVDCNRGPILLNRVAATSTTQEEDDMSLYPMKLEASAGTNEVLPWNGKAGVLNVIPTATDVTLLHKPWNWGPRGGVGGGNSAADASPESIEVNQPGEYNIPAGTTRIVLGYSSATSLYVFPVAS
jgi:GH25 family lysozyme M1 (1,4-beta-N-acetylmuramidase)